jgi:hypothetical protein
VARPTDDHDASRRTPSEPASSATPHDGRGREPGEHPTVERSGRSRGTAIAFAAALAGAALLYVLIALGVTLPGL